MDNEQIARKLVGTARNLMAINLPQPLDEDFVKEVAEKLEKYLNDGPIEYEFREIIGGTGEIVFKTEYDGPVVQVGFEMEKSTDDFIEVRISSEDVYDDRIGKTVKFDMDEDARDIAKSLAEEGKDLVDEHS